MEILASAKQIAAMKGWKLQGETMTEAEFKTTISVRSWGESVKVQAWDNPSSPGTSVVTVSSSARFQVTDMGKSGSNVELMMNALLQGAGLAPVVPVTLPTGPVQGSNAPRKFCAYCGRSMPLKSKFCPGCGQAAD